MSYRTPVVRVEQEKRVKNFSTDGFERAMTKNEVDPQQLTRARSASSEALEAVLTMFDRGPLSVSEKAELKKAHDGLVTAKNALMSLAGVR